MHNDKEILAALERIEQKLEALAVAKSQSTKAPKESKRNGYEDSKKIVLQIFNATGGAMHIYAIWEQFNKKANHPLKHDNYIIPTCERMVKEGLLRKIRQGIYEPTSNKESL